MKTPLNLLTDTFVPLTSFLLSLNHRSLTLFFAEISLKHNFNLVKIKEIVYKDKEEEVRCQAGKDISTRSSTST